MATNYTTRTTTRPPEPNGRSIAVSRKVQIGGSDGTIVSQQSIQTKQLNANEINANEINAKKTNADEINAKKINVHDLNGESTDLLELLDSLTPASSGIDIIGSEQTFTGATKIQFQGDKVYISKKDDGTIVIRIGTVTINPLKSMTEEMEQEQEQPFTLVRKYAFGPDTSSSSDESWSLPSGKSSGFISVCHNVEDIPAITLTFTGGNDVVDFGVENLTSTLSINLVCGVEPSPISHRIAFVKLDGNQIDGDGWTFNGAEKTGNGIKFKSIVYTTPSEVIADIKSHIGGGNTWELTCELDKIKLETDNERYAYSDFQPEIVDGTALTVTNYYGADTSDAATISDDASSYSSCVSGISYTSSETPTGITVTPFQTKNHVDRIGYTDEYDKHVRGKITATIGDKEFVKIIYGKDSDTKETAYPTSVDPQYFYFGSDCTGKTYEVTQTMYGSGSDVDINAYAESKTGTIEASSDSSYDFDKKDTYNTIEFYTEDRGGDYNRVLAYIGNGGTLQIADVEYDPTQTVVDNEDENYADYYNCQAVVQNGKLIHPSKVNDKLGGTIPTSYASDTTTPRYYVRKITRDKDDTSQNSTAKLNIGECNGINPLASIWIASGTLPTLMMYKLENLGAGAVNTDGSIDFSLASFAADPHTNSPFYIVIKLDGASAQESIQGPIIFSIGQ